KKRDEGGGGVNGGGKATAKVVVVLRRLLAEEVTMVSEVKRGGSGVKGMATAAGETSGGGWGDVGGDGKGVVVGGEGDKVAVTVASERE
nr:hypothetical protein [Tanacetum cinerariifolium]